MKRFESPPRLLIAAMIAVCCIFSFVPAMSAEIASPEIAPQEIVSLADGWNSGAMPVDTYGIGGVYLRGMPENTFYFADYRGSMVYVYKGGDYLIPVDRNEVLYWNTSIDASVVKGVRAFASTNDLGERADAVKKLKVIPASTTAMTPSKSVETAYKAGDSNGCSQGAARSYGGPGSRVVRLLRRLLPRNRGGCGLFGRGCG